MEGYDNAMPILKSKTQGCNVKVKAKENSNCRCIVCYTCGLCSNLLLNVGSVALTVISGYKRDFRETVRELERTTVHPRLKYS